MLDGCILSYFICLHNLAQMSDIWLQSCCRTCNSSLCSHQSDIPRDLPLDCLIIGPEWKQAVSLNHMCWLGSSWQRAALCGLQGYIPLWLWSVTNVRRQRLECERVQKWVGSKKKKKCLKGASEMTKCQFNISYILHWFSVYTETNEKL